MNRSKAVQERMHRVASLVGRGDVRGATAELEHDYFGGGDVFDQDPGDIEGRLECCRIASAYVFAARQHLEETTENTALSPVKERCARAGQGALRWLEDHYGAGLFARLAHDELVSAGELDPYGAGDTIIVALYARAMVAGEHAAPFLHQLLSLTPQTEPVANLQAHVRLMLPDADQADTAPTEEEAEKQDEPLFTINLDQITPAEVGKTVLSLVGEFIAGW